MLSPVRVDVLGTLRAFRGGEPVELAGRKQRQVLAALALHGGRPVSVDALVDLLWGDAPPPSAVPTLQVYVAGLRRALEPDRPARTRAQVVVTVTPGYALRLPDGALDAARFYTAVTAAHQRLSTWAGGAAGPAVARPGLSAGELVEVVGELDAALASWRGIPYVELGELPAAVAERARLAELRMVALEDRAAALLALGRHATVAAELEALTAEHPLRERLWLLRVMALAGADRQADALQALRQVRRILADELGLDPGAALQELEGAILRRDPAVVGRSAPVAGSPARPAPARPLPGTDLSTDIGTGTADPRSWPLVGRAAELAELEELLAVAARGIPQFAVLVGEPGIGKTRLGQELAARAREHGFTVLVGRCSEEETARRCGRGRASCVGCRSRPRAAPSRSARTLRRSSRCSRRRRTGARGRPAPSCPTMPTPPASCCGARWRGCSSPPPANAPSW